MHGTESQSGKRLASEDTVRKAQCTGSKSDDEAGYNPAAEGRRGDSTSAKDSSNRRVVLSPRPGLDVCSSAVPRLSSTLRVRRSIMRS